MSNNNDHRRDLLEGLLFVETGIDEDEIVDIYTIQMGKMVLIESGGEVFARAWLGEHAQRLVEWQPRRRHDDLSGIWYRPAQERSPRGKQAPRKECTHASGAFDSRGRNSYRDVQVSRR